MSVGSDPGCCSNLRELTYMEPDRNSPIVVAPQGQASLLGSNLLGPR